MALAEDETDDEVVLFAFDHEPTDAEVEMMRAPTPPPLLELRQCSRYPGI